MDGSIEKTLLLAAFQAGLLPDEIASEFSFLARQIDTCTTGCSENLDILESLPNIKVLAEELCKVLEVLAASDDAVNSAPWLFDQIYTCRSLMGELALFNSEFARLLGSDSKNQFFDGLLHRARQFCTGIPANLVLRIAGATGLPLGRTGLDYFRKLGEFLTTSKRSFVTAEFNRKVGRWHNDFIHQLNDLITPCSTYLPELANLRELQFLEKDAVTSWNIQEIIDSIFTHLEEKGTQQDTVDPIQVLSNDSKKIHLINPTSDQAFPFLIQSNNSSSAEDKQSKPADVEIYLLGKPMVFKSRLAKNILLLMLENHDFQKGYSIHDYDKVNPRWDYDEVIQYEEELSLEEAKENGINLKKEKSAWDKANAAFRQAISQLRTELAKFMGLDNSKKKDLILSNRDRSRSCTFYRLNIDLIKELGKRS